MTGIIVPVVLVNIVVVKLKAILLQLVSEVGFLYESDPKWIRHYSS